MPIAPPTLLLVWNPQVVLKSSTEVQARGTPMDCAIAVHSEPQVGRTATMMMTKVKRVKGRCCMAVVVTTQTMITSTYTDDDAYTYTAHHRTPVLELNKVGQK